MQVSDVLVQMPETDKVLVILSGGMDSTIAMRFAVERYGAENVSAITFNYGQKQVAEIEKAKASTFRLNVDHKVVDAKFLQDIGKGFSANLDPDIKMPTIKEVLGDPTPITYVPNRNMILMSIAAAYAETKGIEYIFAGIQATDEYGYWDTTARFAEKMNAVFAENRKIKIKLVAPFVKLSKADEIKLLLELDNNVALLIYTLTCYNPAPGPFSCGKCPSCAERISAFMQNKLEDPIFYSIDIPWVK